MTTRDDVLTAIDLADYVEKFVKLEKKVKTHTGLCPFHAEKSPSFTVYEGTKGWWCFGCQTGGTLFDFQMRYHKQSFVEALKTLAQLAGVEIDSETEKKKEQLFRVLEVAAESFHQGLLQSQSPLATRAREYLDKRN